MAAEDHADLKSAGPFVQTKADLARFLQIESEKYKRKNPMPPLICLRESDYLWKHACLLRKAEYYVNSHKKLMGLLYRYRLKKFQIRHNLSIPLNTFDCGLKIMHLGSILVNSDVRVGKNCSIHINTGIVAGGSNDGVPVLGDGIVIGMGAVILGDIYLAKNIAVGANALVNRSFFEENIAVAGVPARKISDNGSRCWNRKEKENPDDSRGD